MNRYYDETVSGMIFDIEKYRVHDGSGIRTIVFLKGCSLWCPWCCNPESQKHGREMGVFRNLCTGCRICESVCPEGAIGFENDRPTYDESKCVFCGKCVSACLKDARKIFGKRISVREVMDEVRKDANYYTRSGGGLTVSGGEPALQPFFTRELLRASRAELYQTAVETSGAVAWERLWTAVELADDVLFDIKATTSTEFSRISDYPFSGYIKNLEELVSRGKNVILRCPIIRDANDSKDHILGVRNIAMQMKISRVDLLAFHQFGRHKYEALDKPYSLSLKEPVSEDELSSHKKILMDAGIDVTIGG